VVWVGVEGGGHDAEAMAVSEWLKERRAGLQAQLACSHHITACTSKRRMRAGLSSRGGGTANTSLVPGGTGGGRGGGGAGGNGAGGGAGGGGVGGGGVGGGGVGGGGLHAQQGSVIAHEQGQLSCAVVCNNISSQQHRPHL
jgi:hypothetical protein